MKTRTYNKLIIVAGVLEAIVICGCILLASYVLN